MFNFNRNYSTANQVTMTRRPKKKITGPTLDSTALDTLNKLADFLASATPGSPVRIVVQTAPPSELSAFMAAVEDDADNSVALDVRGFRQQEVMIVPSTVIQVSSFVES